MDARLAPSVDSLGALARARAGVEGDALVLPDARLSFAELDARARRWARALIAAGVQPGEHVGLLFNTSLAFVEILFGAAMAGAAVVPINARYQPGELAYVIENADLALLAADGSPNLVVDLMGRVREALPSLDASGRAPREAPKLRGIVAVDGAPGPGVMTDAEFLAAGASVPESEVEHRIAGVDPGDIAIILYTSGTTAHPKGCLLSHGAILHNARALARRYDFRAGDRFWSPLPIFHIAGMLPLTAAIDAGGAYLTIPNFEAGMALEMLEREGATHAYPCFVTIMQDLINHPRFAETDLSRVRLMNSNLAVQPPWIAEAMAKAMPQAVQVGTYGLTEGVGTICTSRPADPYDLRPDAWAFPSTAGRCESSIRRPGRNVRRTCRARFGPGAPV